MTTGSIPKHLVVFSLPMLLGNIVQAAYGIINFMWVGKFLGKADLAAAGNSMQVVFLLIPVAIGITMGTSILISQFAGARNWPQVKKVVQTSTLLVGIISILLLAVGELLSPSILRWMQTPADAYGLAVSYLRVFLISVPFSFGLFLMSSMLRGVGDSKTPIIFQTGGLVLTAILDPILMLGIGRFHGMGLNGTAVAATLMQALGLVAVAVHIRRKDHVVSPDWLHLRIDWHTAWLIMKIGFPSVIQQSMVSMGNIFVTGIVNAFGVNAAAALASAGRIDMIAFMPIMTFGIAVSTMAGQNIGAGRIHRVKEVFGWGILIGGGITLVLSTFALLAPSALLHIFVRDPEVVKIGISYLHIIASCYVLYAVLFISNGIINGAGYTFVTTIISLITFAIVRVPLAMYLSHRMHSVVGVWYAIVGSAMLSLVISLSYYASGMWKRPIIRHYPPIESSETEESVVEVSPGDPPI